MEKHFRQKLYEGGHGKFNFRKKSIFQDDHTKVIAIFLMELYAFLHKILLIILHISRVTLKNRFFENYLSLYVSDHTTCLKCSPVSSIFFEIFMLRC